MAISLSNAKVKRNVIFHKVVRESFPATVTFEWIP